MFVCKSVMSADPVSFFAVTGQSACLGGRGCGGGLLAAWQPIESLGWDGNC